MVGLLPACVSARVFNELDTHVWKLTYKWAKFTHPHKSKRWIILPVLRRVQPARRDRWVFGDRDSGAYLVKFAWTKITRHTLVKGWASPDDPALADYWAARRRRGRPPLDRARLRLLQGSADAARSAASCCSTPTTSRDTPTNGNGGSQRPARRSATTRSPSTRGPETPDVITVFRLIHTHCRDRHARRHRQCTSTSAVPTVTALGACLSRLPGKRARPVLRGPRRSNAPGLPDWRIWFYLLEAAG